MSNSKDEIWNLRSEIWKSELTGFAAVLPAEGSSGPDAGSTACGGLLSSASVKVLVHQALYQAGLAQNTTAEICLTGEDVEPDTLVLYRKNAEHAVLKRFDVDGVVDAIGRQDLLDSLALTYATGDVDHRNFLIVEVFRVNQGHQAHFKRCERFG